MMEQGIIRAGVYDVSTSIIGGVKYNKINENPHRSGARSCGV